jgi:hypothetical protein
MTDGEINALLLGLTLGIVFTLWFIEFYSIYFSGVKYDDQS